MSYFIDYAELAERRQKGYANRSSMKIQSNKKLLSALLVTTSISGILFGLPHIQNASQGVDAQSVAAKSLNHGSTPSSPTARAATNASPTTASPTTARASTPQKSATTGAKPPTVATTPASAVSHYASLYTDPSSNVAQGALAWATTNPGDANVMNQLASTPLAKWFGDWSGDISSATNSYVSRAAAAGQIPELVAYNIPDRDCGGQSSGGSTSVAAYEAWIDGFSSGIGQRSAIVVVEPDALPDMEAANCLSSSQQQDRLNMLVYAVHSLRTRTKAAIYLDAGNASWVDVSTMSQLLTQADIADATGFSINVSGFQSTATSTAYGTNLANNLGGKHFVIDTSRNGNGPDATNSWCNPAGRAFGIRPTLQTGNSLIDGYLWIKNPGESDGSCGPSEQGSTPPAAGGWWPQYALSLAH